ncbi:hypothetical protein EIP91_004137 [Steccherinum ochraceum]|uniref:MYND-type domain-containing protein n=1 Tax=Steccherinum ochraceum TaxID=92696 RepID=A0A4R0R9A9_9APHY|nr:hypothetical protein EIP91_004137 [Steccherinum ochraceum]
MDILGLTQSTLPPRASHRYSAEELPPLEKVISDVEYLKRNEELVRQLDTDEGLQEYMAQNNHELQGYPIAYAQAMIWAYFVPDLWNFCLSVVTEDVPEDILPEYIWMQRKNLRYHTDMSPEEQRCWLPEANPGERIDQRLYFRQNLADCLLCPQVNQMEEAVVELTRMVEDFKSYLYTIDSPNKDTPWLERPLLFARLAEARVLCNYLDDETKVALERFLEGMAKTTEIINDLPWHLIVTRMSLALVLHVLSVEPEKQQSHTDWAVSHLRKRPQYKDRAIQFMLRSGQPLHPVLAKLGTDWLEDKPSTEHAECRQERRCVRCQRERPVVKKLVMCTKCKSACYCSQECRKADWPRHQPICSKWASIWFRAPAQVAKQLGNAKQWEMTPGAFNSAAVIHALALTQDISRARTHVIFRILVPATRTKSRAVQDKLYVSKIGVFKLEDVLPDIQLLISGPTLEITRRSISRMLDQGQDYVRVLCLNWTVLQGVTVIFSSKSFTFPQTQIRRMSYDPSWRDKVNRDRPPPGVPILPSGTPDSEFDYDESPLAARRVASRNRDIPLLSSRGILRMMT